MSWVDICSFFLNSCHGALFCWLIANVMSITHCQSQSCRKAVIHSCKRQCKSAFYNWHRILTSLHENPPACVVFVQSFLRPKDIQNARSGSGPYKHKPIPSFKLLMVTPCFIHLVVMSADSFKSPTIYLPFRFLTERSKSNATISNPLHKNNFSHFGLMANCLS